VGWAQQDGLGVVVSEFCHTNNKQIIGLFLSLSQALDKFATADGLHMSS
jgi:hypothetical protein